MGKQGGGTGKKKATWSGRRKGTVGGGGGTGAPGSSDECNLKELNEVEHHVWGGLK